MPRQALAPEDRRTRLVQVNVTDSEYKALDDAYTRYRQQLPPGIRPDRKTEWIRKILLPAE